MSKVVITRKIPIRTVNKANNAQTQQPTTPSDEQPTNNPSPSVVSSTNNINNNTTTTSNSPNTASNNSSSTNNTSTTQPSNNNNSSSSLPSSTTAQSSPSSINNIVNDNNLIEEEDLYNPKINYEDIEKQSIKFRKFSKAFVIAKKKEQVRFYLPKVEQIILQRDSKCSIVPLSMCILYHRQNGGEYALCIFKDKKMTDLCPLTIEKTEISIVLNPSQNNNNSKQRSVLQILSENLQGMNVEYYLQFESELQLLSVYTALDKSLMYNGVDIKESIPSFNSLLITYSSRQMKDEVTSPRAPVKFKWCEKYVEQYASGSTSVVTESLRTKSTEKKQVKSFRKTEDNNDSSDSSSGRGARLSQTDNSYSPVDDTRRRYLEDNDDSLGSRHYIPSGDDNTDSDGGRRRHREAIIAKSSPIQSSPLLERKFSEEDRYRPTSNDSDGDSSPTPKIPPPQEQQPTSTNSSSTIQDSSNNSTTTTPGKKVIKRVIKRVPAKNATE